MGITIKEIAKLAGCSRGTVDRALRNSSDIKAETKQKIMEIVKEYNYKPNFAGQALALSKKSYRVLVVLNSLYNDFFDDIIKGVKKAESAYSSSGIVISIVELERFSVERQMNCLNSIDWNDYEALIITAVDNPVLGAKLSEIAAKGKVVITMNSDTDFEGKLTYVGCDYMQSGRTAGGLIKLACRNSKNGLCYITGSSNVLGHNQRMNGVKEIIKTCPNIMDCGIIACDDNEDDSYSKAKDALINNKEISIICGAAGSIVGANKAAKELGRDITIIGFDNTPKINELIHNGDIVATINQHPIDQGYIAVQTLFEYVFAKVEPARIINTELTIVIKENL